MLKKLILIFIVVYSGICNAQVVSPDSAKYHEGSFTTVCGEITSGKINENETVFINFGAPYPGNSFSAVIFAKDSLNFKNHKPAYYLKERQICVSGIIKMQKGKPEIIVTSPDQIRLPGK